MDELERGMQLQLDGLRRALADGMPRAGWKVGFNVQQFRERLGLAEPVVGWLRGDRLLASGDRFAAPPGAMLLIEAEIALRVRRAATGAEATLASTQPAIEIVDYAQPRGGVAEMLSHSVFHRASVLGRRVGPEALPSLGDGVPRVRVNGELRASARPGLVPADLGELIAFVDRFLARFGEELRDGDLILSGSYTDPVPVRAGDRVQVEFDDLETLEVLIE
jgi:2-keto-4-pentenoate hydratase